VPAIYIIAVVLVLLFLVGAYRSMGAGASTDEDPRGVLEAVAASAGEAAASLAGAPVSAESAHAVRRRLEGCAQGLERIAATPVDATLDQARTALEFAVDELTWSARLAETPGYGRDEALKDASRALQDRGTENLALARRLIGR
jgi:hypothetical protein